MTLTNEMSMSDLIDAGLYDKDLSEPTPLEQKGVLVKEVKSEFFDDLVSRGIHIETMNLAWYLAEDVNGEDEALNPIFLHNVLKYIDVLERFYEERSNEV